MQTINSTEIVQLTLESAIGINMIMIDDAKQYLGLPLWENFVFILYITCVVVVYVYYICSVLSSLLTCSISNCKLLAETGLMERICVYVCMYVCISLLYLCHIPLLILSSLISSLK